MKGYLKQPQGGEGLRLFRNLGNGKFRDVSAETGLNRVFMPMGLNFGDIDNDGFLDFYLGSGNPSYASPIPNVLFHNDSGHGVYRHHRVLRNRRAAQRPRHRLCGSG